MDLERLALVDGQAAKAVVTWSMVGRGREPTEGWLRHGELWLDFDQWCELSGLSARAMLRLVPVLLGAGIVGLEGADPQALMVARQLVAKRLKKR